MDKYRMDRDGEQVNNLGDQVEETSQKKEGKDKEV